MLGLTPQGRSFWLWHLAVPVLLSIALLVPLETTEFDLRVAEGLFHLEGDHWALRNHWMTYEVMHHFGKQLIILIGFLTLVALALSFWRDGMARYRRSLAYLLFCLVVIPGSIAFFKHFSQVPCPWDLAMFGADLPYRHNMAYPLAVHATGNCFPSGHASGAFSLLALYFSAYPHRAGRAWPLLLPGILLGLAFGFAQQLRGAHFLSHDIWTATYCWLAALALYRMCMPRPGKER